MRFSENRRLAACVLVLSIFASIFLLGGGGLVSERKDIANVYRGEYDEVLGAVYSAGADMVKCAESARKLAGIARLWLEDEAAIDAVQEYAAQITDSGTIASSGQYAALKASVESLHTELSKAGAADDVDVKLTYGDFRAAVDRIGRDRYNMLARTFNDTLSSFPARIVAPLFGVKPLDTYL